MIAMIKTFNDLDKKERDLMLLLIAELLDLRLSEAPIEVS